MPYNTDKLTEISSLLSRLSQILSQGFELTEEQDQSVQNLLSKFEDGTKISNLTNIVTDLEEDYVIEQEPEDIQTSDIYYYGIGETCLLLDPFDNYRLFTLYKDYGTKEPLDISDGQTLYLIFRNGSKEVRIKEYKEFGPYINIDREKGQVLFKITKTQVNDVFNMRSRDFFITRIYETYDPVTDSLISSDEEVIYSGFWAERNEEKESRLRQMIEQLQDLLDQRTAALEQMVQSINELVEQNTTLSERNQELEKEIVNVTNEYNKFKDEVENSAPGLMDAIQGEMSGHKAEIIDSQTILIDYSKADDDTRDKLDKITGSNPNVSRTSLINNLNNPVR